MDPAVYNMTSPYKSGYLDYYNLSTTTGYETNYTTIASRSSKISIARVVAITITSIIFALGILGNGLVIWITGFRMKKIDATWFLNLAIADLLCCATIPLYISDWFDDEMCANSESSLILCAVDFILLSINTATSILFLTAMSIDRWVYVMWESWAKVHRTRKLLRITAGIIWVLVILWTGLIIYLLAKCVNKNLDRCFEIRNIVSLVMMFLIPFLIIVTSYVTIFFKLRKINTPQRSRKPYMIIITVIVCFFICWFPYYIWPLTPLYDGNDLEQSIVDVITTCLASLNSCINPIIYVLMGKDIRQGLQKSILERVKTALDDHSDDPCEEQNDSQSGPSTISVPPISVTTTEKRDEQEDGASGDTFKTKNNIGSCISTE